MRISEMDDQLLVKAYLNGKQVAFEELLSRHRQRIFSYICMMVKDQEQAEDIFQDTFIRVIQTLQGGRYTDEGKFLPWVMRIAHNLCIDFFRKGKRMPTFDSDQDDFDIFDVLRQNDANVEDQLIRLQTEDQLQKLLVHLPKEQKEVVYMRHYAEMSFQEIADQTGVSINTALGRMRYALINLRKLITQHHPELCP
jgi:RNA polymerase sigma factor (sigma-70 family)